MNAKDRIAQNIAYFRNKTVNPETGVPPMTQEQLADAIGMTKRQVGRYEQGDQEPSGSTLDKIADALNLAPGQLFRRTQTGPDLSGLWWVSCQVWKDGVERVDTNAVMVLQDGDHLTLDSDRAQGENAIEAGDYAWVGELVHRRATRTLIGWYESADEGTDYSGSYCFTLHPQEPTPSANGAAPTSTESSCTGGRSWRDRKPLQNSNWRWRLPTRNRTGIYEHGRKRLRSNGLPLRLWLAA